MEIGARDGGAKKFCTSLPHKVLRFRFRKRLKEFPLISRF